MEFTTFGRHIMADIWGADFFVLDDLDLLERHMIEAAGKTGDEVLSVSSEKFEPFGCTLLVLSTESHMSIHTFPEKQYAAVDCFTFGSDKDPQPAIDFLTELLRPKNVITKKWIRGLHRT